MLMEMFLFLEVVAVVVQVNYGHRSPYLIPSSSLTQSLSTPQQDRKSRINFFLLFAQLCEVYITRAVFGKGFGACIDAVC